MRDAAHAAAPAAGRPIRVLIVDDKAAARQALKALLAAAPDIEVVGTVCDPWAAVARMRLHAPDVLTLELDMPRADGVRLLDQLLRDFPVPLVVCSRRAPADARAQLHQLGHAAAAVLGKPERPAAEWTVDELPIGDAVRAASRASGAARAPAAIPPRARRASRPTALAAASASTEPRRSVTAVVPVIAHDAAPAPGEPVIAIGASTGGTEALLAVLRAMPAHAPGIVVVQHMPERFTGAFAARLDAHCAITVREAAAGDVVTRGVALIAPGNHHLLLRRAGGGYQVELKDGPLVNRHRPSVDVLFRSTARAAGSSAVGVILTGMGDDGARGMLELRQAGAYTVAQDEATCVVFGMPAEAIKRGGVDRVLPLDRIAADVAPRRR